MKKLIEKFIVWYLLERNNAMFEYKNYVVRMFSMDYYDKLMSNASALEHPNCRCSPIPVFNDTSEKGGSKMSYIEKSLVEVAKETDADFFGGYSVFVLQNENDKTGKHIDTSYSVRAILREHPEIANYRVKYENDFFGTTVLRVEKGGVQE